MIAKTLQPSYFAVIFTSIRMEGENGYAEMADKQVSTPATLFQIRLRLVFRFMDIRFIVAWAEINSSNTTLIHMYN
ncbi:MAG: hypothetical protein FD155_1962 [Bacteroidetes bacterium]|nr:MAG: hypothetical protein FD155_1962 [Bacteroidota bacterium]